MLSLRKIYNYCLSCRMTMPFPVEQLERGCLIIRKIRYLKLCQTHTCLTEQCLLLLLDNTLYYFHRGYVCLLFLPGIPWAPPLPISANEINEILISWDRKINSVVVRALTSAVGNPGSRPWSNECSIIYAKYKAPTEQIEEAYPRITTYLGSE